MQKVLIAEDNEKLRMLMERYLRSHGFEVSAAENGAVALDLFEQDHYDLILLDILMPEVDGVEVCRQIRRTSGVPIMFLTALASEGEQLTGYGVGADDYIVKPASLPVLVAKCNALLGRRQTQEEWLEHGGIRLNKSRQIAFVEGEAVSLSTTDFRLLQLFLEHTGEVLGRDEIILEVWGDDYEGYDRSVDTHVKLLRKALGSKGKLVRTVVRRGYVMD